MSSKARVNVLLLDSGGGSELARRSVAVAACTGVEGTGGSQRADAPGVASGGWQRLIGLGGSASGSISPF